MIRLVEDVGAPAAVTAIDMLTLELVPNYNEIACYGMTIAGFVGGFFLRGRAGDFMARIGGNSLPLTARAIRERIKGGVAVGRGASRLALRPRSSVRSYPAQPHNHEGAWPTAV